MNNNSLIIFTFKNIANILRWRRGRRTNQLGPNRCRGERKEEQEEEEKEEGGGGGGEEGGGGGDIGEGEIAIGHHFDREKVKGSALEQSEEKGMTLAD